MASDTLTLNAGSGGSNLAVDVDAGDGNVVYQWVKLVFGANDTFSKVAAGTPLPVQLSDGTDTVLVTAAGELSVLDSNSAAIAASLSVLDDWDNAASDGASVSGDTAHDAVDAGEPVKIGGFAKAAAPTAVSADLDRVNAWFDLSGRLSVWDGGLNMSIDDGGNVITVDGTVDLGATDNAVLDAIAASAAAIDTDTSTIATSLSVLDDWDNGASDGASVSGDTAHDAVDAGEPVKIGGFAKAAAPTAVSADLDRVNAWFDLSGRLSVWDGGLNMSIDDGGNVITVDGTVDLGATDNAVLDAIAASVAAIDTDTTTIATSLSVLDDWDNAASDGVTVSGDVAHDGVDAGEPVKIGGYAKATAPTAVSADADRVNAWFLLNGAQATVLTAAGALIGGDAANGLDVDVTRLSALVAGTAAIGKLLPPDIDVTTHTNYIKKYYTSAGAATDGIIWSPAAGKRWHITTLYINISAAATITLEDDLAAGDSAIWKGEFAANSGVVLTFDPMYPWASGEDAADLIITTSAGNVYVTAVGFEI